VNEVGTVASNEVSCPLTGARMLGQDRSRILDCGLDRGGLLGSSVPA
jgi:hypothetical protein